MMNNAQIVYEMTLKWNSRQNPAKALFVNVPESNLRLKA